MKLVELELGSAADLVAWQAGNEDHFATLNIRLQRDEPCTLCG
jgi:hypothetical protein